MTTAISVWPTRVAVATMLKPAAQMKPVFMPIGAAIVLEQLVLRAQDRAARLDRRES